jgi:hypothetical protein
VGDAEGPVLIREIFPTFEVRGKTPMGHHLTNISRVLRGVAVSPGYDLPGWMDGFDLFCGYLLSMLGSRTATGMWSDASSPR